MKKLWLSLIFIFLGCFCCDNNLHLRYEVLDLVYIPEFVLNNYEFILNINFDNRYQALNDLSEDIVAGGYSSYDTVMRALQLLIDLNLTDCDDRGFNKELCDAYNLFLNKDESVYLPADFISKSYKIKRFSQVFTEIINSDHVRATGAAHIFGRLNVGNDATFSQQVKAMKNVDVMGDHNIQGDLTVSSLTGSMAVVTNQNKTLNSMLYGSESTPSSIVSRDGDCNICVNEIDASVVNLIDLGSNNISIFSDSSLTSNVNLTLNVNDASRLIDLSGDLSIAADLITTGGNSITLVADEVTSVVLPATGTLCTLDGIETLRNKTLLDAVLEGVTIISPIISDLILDGATINSSIINGATGLSLQDNGSNNLTIASSGALTTGRTLTLNVNDSSRSIGLGGNLTFGGSVTTVGNVSTGGALTTGGAFTTSGSGGLTLTTSGATNITLPTTGTLCTVAGTETLTNKTLTSPTINNPTINSPSCTGNLSCASNIVYNTAGTALNSLGTSAMGGVNLVGDVTKYPKLISIASSLTISNLLTTGSVNVDISSYNFTVAPLVFITSTNSFSALGFLNLYLGTVTTSTIPVNALAGVAAVGSKVINFNLLVVGY